MQAKAGRGDREHPIVVAVHDEGRNVDTRQIRPKVGPPRANAAGERRGRRELRGVLEHLDRVVVAKKRPGEGDRVARERGPHRVEDGRLHSTGVVRRLQQERRERRDEDDRAHPARTVDREVARALARPHREADQRGVAHVERRHQLVEVGGERVVVVARVGAARAAEATPVVDDDPVAGFEQSWNLLLPDRAREGPAVDQNHRTTRADVLVVEVDLPGFVTGQRDVRHGASQARAGGSPLACVR